MVLVENTGAGMLNLRHGVSLKPGANEVDAETWAKCRDDQITRHLMDTGRIKVSKAHPSGEAPKAALPTVPTVDSGPSLDAEPETPVEDEKESEPEQEMPAEKMSASTARKFVKSCTRVDILEGMLQDETRKSVIEAIEARLDELD